MIGLAGGVVGGCWAKRLDGRASARIATKEVFMRSPGKMAGRDVVILDGAAHSRNGVGRTGKAICRPLQSGGLQRILSRPGLHTDGRVAIE